MAGGGGWSVNCLRRFLAFRQKLLNPLSVRLDMATAAERVKGRLKPDGTVCTTRANVFCNSLHEDLTELLADYERMCRLAGEMAQQAHPPERT